MPKADRVFSTPRPLSSRITKADKPQRPIDATLRRRIEAAIEKLIATLDVAEPDPDLETEPEHDEDGGDDEPSLGSLEVVYQATWGRGDSDDRENEHDGREPDADFEPDTSPKFRRMRQQKRPEQTKGAEASDVRLVGVSIGGVPERVLVKLLS